ncbi:MAG: NAD(P)H-dependent oxidoreductase subunit E [Acidimicrobiia bacterium]|nr:NAD(P)H-dependent oxidoreductase subunit E [Acidimicrobiia bacterium]
MTRLSPSNVLLAKEIISRYPRPKSALISLLHLSQEQNGHITEEAMEHIAELVGVTPAEVLGTCSFYEMFKREPVGRYMINICTNISCQLSGGEELLHHAEKTLGIKPGGTTADGMFTLEDVECIAACTEGPCLQVNYRYEYRLDDNGFDRLISDLRNGNRPDIPNHGTLAQVRQQIDPDKLAGIGSPEVTGKPHWFASREPVEEGAS